jgi:predicted DNA-binding protein YlxM (UPF0122 family)
MQEIQKLYLARELSVQQISEMFNVSRPTVYRAIESIPEVIKKRQSNQ